MDKKARIKLGIIGLLLVGIFSVCFVLAGVDDWKIEENKVYVNDSKVYISAEPHTIIGSGWVVFNFTSKVYSGDIDAVLGFDSGIHQPTKIERYNPTLEEKNRSYTCNTDYFDSNSTYAWCYENITTYGESNITNGSYFKVIFEHYFDSGNLAEKTIYWTEEYLDEWKKTSLTFDSINYEYGGMDKWYYTQGTPINSNQEYVFRVFIKNLDPFKDGKNKYWFAIKPSGETIQKAISDNHLYALDPWTESLNVGLVAYYNLNDTNDVSGNNNNLTNQGASFVSGCKIGNCADFELSEIDYMNVTLSGVADGNHTISAWFKLESSATYQYIVSFADDVTDLSGIDYRQDIDDLRYGAYEPPPEDWVYSTLDFTDTNWHFAVMTMDSNGNVINAYLDNVDYGSTSGNTFDLSSSTIFLIGTTLYGGSTAEPFDGLIDEVGVWSRILSSAEITQLWNEGNGITYAEEEEDTTAPYFIDGTPTNQTISSGTALAYNINATDETALDCFVVNDTTNFKINCSGYLENNTLLSSGLYNLNVTINDTSNNQNSSFFWVNVTISSYSQNITQPLTTNTLTDRTGSLKKDISQSFTINSLLKRIGGFFRDLIESITINILVERLGSFFKNIEQSFSINELVERIATISNRISTDYFRLIVNYAPSFVERLVNFLRNPFQDLNFNTLLARLVDFFRKLFDSFNINTIVEKLRNVIKNIFQLIQMVFSFLSKSSVIAWNWITSVETLIQLPAIEGSRVSWELNDLWAVDASSPQNWTNTNKTYNLPVDCADVRVEIDNINITGYSNLVSNADCDYTISNNNTLQPTNTSLINITYTTTAITSSEGDWIASNKRITQKTNWINTLTLSNPSVHTYGNISINITTDKNAISGTINITNNTNYVFPHSFSNTDGNVNWTISSLESGDDYIFTTRYKTEEINLTKTNHSETILGKDYEIHNVTITANSTRPIFSVYSYFNFSDEGIISNRFYTCDNGLIGCDEDISNRIDVVWEDQDADGSYDYVEWYITNLTQNKSYQLKNDKGFPVEVTTTSEILNKPIYAFDNILWKTTITMYNPNAFSTEKVYKYEFPLGATDIKLDDISKNLQYPTFGGLAPYVTIIDKDDPVHANSVYLSPGETKTFIVRYRTSSVTVYSSTYFPTYFEVSEKALISQVLRINNQAEDDVTDVEYRIPIDYAEDLIVCSSERKDGCEEDEDAPQYNLTLDTQETVKGDYILEIDEIASGETKYITLSYYTPTAIITNIQKGRRSVQGNLTTFKKLTIESQARFTMSDLRYREPEIACEEVVDILKCRITATGEICDIPIGYECPLKLKLGTLGIGESVTAYIWFVERPEERLEPTFIDNFVDWFMENIWNNGRRIEIKGFWKYIVGFLSSKDPTTGEMYIPLYRLIFVGSLVGLILGLVIWFRIRKRKKFRRKQKRT